MRIEQASSSSVADLWASVEPRVGQAQCLEEAAQELAATLHTQFEESVVLARVYTTVRFDALPPTKQVFARNVAASAGAASELTGTTPVLSLIGTHGQEGPWNDCRNSQRHAAIPLISSAFVGAIPMIARLLHELGVPSDWIDSHDSEIIIETIGQSAGLFCVQKAADATDHEGRKIITAQDFVSTYHVGSVFGTGGAYLDSGQMFVIVVFCRDVFPRAVAERFLPLTSLFQSKTAPLIGARKIFAQG
ncbi:MAG: hypothetical protein ACE5I7_05940 [Candidatus Binatia bacterium]